MKKKWVKLIIVMSLIFTITSMYSMNSFATDATGSSTSTTTETSQDSTQAKTDSQSAATTTDSTASDSTKADSTASNTNKLATAAKEDASDTTSANDTSDVGNFLKDWTTGQLKYNYIDTEAETFVKSSYYDSSLSLGLAGNFAIVGYSKVSNNVHTNGNILTTNLTNKANFGCNQATKQVSYIQRYTGDPMSTESPRADKDLLVVGNGVTVGLADNNNHFSINGTMLSSPYSVAKDSETTKYIDMVAAKEESKRIAEKLASYADQGITKTSVNEGFDLTNDTDGYLNVYNTTASDLGSNIVNVKLSDTAGTSTLINIDAKGAKTVTLNGLNLYINGKMLSTEETGDFSGGKVLINIYDSTKSDKMFTGTFNNTKAVYASILAPCATLNLDQNVNGTMIGDIVNVNAESHQTTFTGTLKTSKSVTVKKVWSDNNNNANTRPTSIQVRLIADGEATDKVATLNAANNWTYEWTNLDEKKDGTAISYTAEETSVPTGYTASYSTSGDTITITNTYTPSTPTVDKVTQTVKKIWNDSNNNDKVRPASIRVQLYANGKASGDPITLTNANKSTDDNTWTYTWQNLDKTNNAGSILYTVKELVERDGQWVAVEDNSQYDSNYTASYDSTSEGLTTITNTHTPSTPSPTSETVSKTVKKVWNDNDNQAGKRPSSVTVQLYADGQAYGSPVTLTSGDTWEYTWTGLAEKSNGVSIKYTVKELVVPNGYEASYSDDTFTITNTYTPSTPSPTPETVSKTVKKVWDDNDNKADKRPSSVTVQLYANGQAYGDSVTLSSGSTWEYTWNNLPKYSNGAAVNYAVQETSVSAGYEAKYSDDTFTITNTYINSETPGKTTKTVKKVWKDDSDKAGKRPASIKVQLYAGTEKYGNEITLSAKNNWQYTWKNLPKADSDGNEITYHVSETTLITGYTVSYSDDSFTITNTYSNNNSHKTKHHNSNNNGGNNIDTGDNSSMMMWSLLGITSLLALIVIVALRRRNHNI